MAKYFGTDGIRGKANINLTAERAYVVGRYIGHYFSQNGRGKVLIGKDTRLSSSMLEHALASGIAAQGCDVYLASECPTPMIAYLTKEEGFSCGAMISASHNPFYDNGIKLFSNEGTKVSGELEMLIENYIDGKEQIFYAIGEEIGQIYQFSQGLEDYLNYLKKQFPLDLSNYKILVDCANGSSCTTARRLLTELRAQITVINDQPDGININNNCGSTHPSHLQELMKQGTYDLGLAFDGDADRMILVAPDGSLITGDHILYICGCYMKKNNILSNNTVVTTVMANLGLFKAFEHEDINVSRTNVGDKYVYEEMCRYDHSLGGEQSGHIIFKRYATTGDGLLTALAVLKIMVEEKKSVLELSEGLKIYPQLLKNVHVLNKEVVLSDKEVLEKIDIVSEKLADNGRILVRPSGTEPLVRVMVEAETDEICHEMVDFVANFIEQKYGIDE